MNTLKRLLVASILISGNAFAIDPADTITPVKQAVIDKECTNQATSDEVHYGNPHNLRGKTILYGNATFRPVTTGVHVSETISIFHTPLLPDAKNVFALEIPPARETQSDRIVCFYFFNEYELTNRYGGKVPVVLGFPIYAD